MMRDLLNELGQRKQQDWNNAIFFSFSYLYINATQLAFLLSVEFVVNMCRTHNQNVWHYKASASVTRACCTKGWQPDESEQIHRIKECGQIAHSAPVTF